VRRILRAPAGSAAETPPCDEATLDRLKAAFERARGNVVRVRELLADDGLEVSYSTLTRWVREAGLREPPRRAGEYKFVPGQEMQHDTSPHRVTFVPAGKPVTVQCAGLVLAYSRQLFVQYYPRFTRFEAKAFLLDAVRFMSGVCPVCIIDNTSVLLAAGADAVVAPEMAAFARTLGFRFRAHRVGNPERKARIERPFAYIEMNFLAGRDFEDFNDLNRQAIDWCRNVANRKPKQALGMSPDAAYLIERPHLRPLPEALPPVYELLERVVDLHGYVSVDTNRYSVPERYVGKSVSGLQAAGRDPCVPQGQHARRPSPADRSARCQEPPGRSSYHPGTARPRHGGRGSVARRPSPEPRPLHRRSQAARSCRQPASASPADRDETHLPGRSVHRRH
jgi:hypothetical protein